MPSLCQALGLRTADKMMKISLTEFASWLGRLVNNTGLKCCNVPRREYSENGSRDYCCYCYHFRCSYYCYFFCGCYYYPCSYYHCKLLLVVMLVPVLSLPLLMLLLYLLLLLLLPLLLPLWIVTVNTTPSITTIITTITTAIHVTPTPISAPTTTFTATALLVAVMIVPTTAATITVPPLFQSCQTMTSDTVLILFRFLSPLFNWK